MITCQEGNEKTLGKHYHQTSASSKNCRLRKRHDYSAGTKDLGHRGLNISNQHVIEGRKTSSLLFCCPAQYQCDFNREVGDDRHKEITDD